MQPADELNRSCPPAWAKDRYPSSSRNTVRPHRLLAKLALVAVAGLGLKRAMVMAREVLPVPVPPTSSAAGR